MFKSVFKMVCWAPLRLSFLRMNEDLFVLHKDAVKSSPAALILKFAKEFTHAIYFMNVAYVDMFLF
jgi:hypothetical protein